MDIDGLEGHFAGKAQRHHDHARDPEEDDVVARHEDVGGMEGSQGLRVLRPAKGAEGPECRREPCLEYVRVLLEGHIGAELVRGPDFRLVAADVDRAVCCVPGRDAMSPPELAADAPILNLAHP